MVDVAKVTMFGENIGTFRWNNAYSATISDNAQDSRQWSIAVVQNGHKPPTTLLFRHSLSGIVSLLQILFPMSITPSVLCLF